MNADDAKRQLTFEQFARLVLDAVEAAGLEYLIGGAVAVWAYAELRTTRDFDVVVNLPGNRIRRLSEELVKRDMLVPPEVILDLLMQPEGDLPPISTRRRKDAEKRRERTHRTPLFFLCEPLRLCVSASERVPPRVHPQRA